MQALSCPECGEKAFSISVRNCGGGAVQIELSCTNCGKKIEWLVHEGTIQDLALKKFHEKETSG